jgi:hypothetical protein
VLRRRLGLALILLTISHPALRSAPGEDDARKAARAFGQALTSGRSEALRPILPEQGRLQLSLRSLGPEEGTFGAGQVEALFRDFLAEGKVRSFEILRLECDRHSTALVHARASVLDRQGRPVRAGVHLVLQVEEDRWVLREIKEASE